MASVGNNAIDEGALDVHQRDRDGQPLNAEVKPQELIDSFITPTDKIFHRNHDAILHVPSASAAETEWKVSLSVEHEVIELVETHATRSTEQWTDAWKGGQGSAVTITHGDLLHSDNVEQLTTTATLECAGNRRQDLADVEKAEGLQWASGAISTATWRGPSMRSVLLCNGVGDPFKDADSELALSRLEEDCAEWARSLHVHMLSAQPAASLSDAPMHDEKFGASIPLAVAMHPRHQCILAMSHNGRPLTEAHGFPVRVVVPGHVGARWVKWLSALRVSTRPDDSPPMRLDYKLLQPPSEEQERRQWRKDIIENPESDKRKAEVQQLPPLQSLGVGSAIEVPSAGAALEVSGHIDVRGYAVGQDGSPVSKVEVIALVQNDANESMADLRKRAAEIDALHWTQADVQSHTEKGSVDDPSALSWAWSLWHAKAPWPDNGNGETLVAALVARAATASGQLQEQESPWNARGFSTRSWPVVRNLRRQTRAE